MTSEEQPTPTNVVSDNGNDSGLPSPGPGEQSAAEETLTALAVEPSLVDDDDNDDDDDVSDHIGDIRIIDNIDDDEPLLTPSAVAQAHDVSASDSASVVGNDNANYYASPVLKMVPDLPSFGNTNAANATGILDDVSNDNNRNDNDNDNDFLSAVVNAPAASPQAVSPWAQSAAPQAQTQSQAHPPQAHAHQHEHEPDYNNNNYYPTYPSSSDPGATAPLARYDSGLFGEDTNTSDSDEDDINDNDDDNFFDEGELNLKLSGHGNGTNNSNSNSNSEADASSFGKSSDSVALIDDDDDDDDDEDDANEDALPLRHTDGGDKLSPPLLLFPEKQQDHLAASAPSLLMGLPQTFRPFEGEEDNTKPQNIDVDLSYISSRPFCTADHNNNNVYEPERTFVATEPASESTPFTTTPPPSSKPTDYSYISSDLFYGPDHDMTHEEPTDKTRTTTSTSTSHAATTKPTSRALYNSLPRNDIPLSSLPMDALHATSSYCTPQDWAGLAMASKAWRGIGREVIEKLWRHAGRCMVEVGVAWARGEHADARELASLYISKGVPIYPTPHGHSYHTIAWRMKLELQALGGGGEEDDENAAGEGGGGPEGATNRNNNNVNVGGHPAAAGGNNDANGNNNRNQAAGGTASNNAAASNTNGEEDSENTPSDLFYIDRYINGSDSNQDNHRRDLFSRNHMTYVEEKAVFWKKKNGIEVQNPNNSAFLQPTPQARGPLFPGRFSFGTGNPNNNLAAGFLGNVGREGVARGPPPGAVGGGFGRDADLPSAPIRPNGPSYGPLIDAANAAVIAVATANDAAAGLLTAGAAGSAAPSASAGRPRYARRQSFSGTVNGSFNSGYNNNNNGNDNGGNPFSAALGLNHNSSSPALASRETSAPASFAPSSSANAEWGAANAPSTTAGASAAAVAPSAPKMTLKIHRHLADQHFFGSPSVNDENGTMNAGKLSMNADFFHPTWERRKGLSNVSNRVENWDGYWDGTGWRTSGDSSGHGDTDASHGTVPGDAAGINDIGETIDQAGEAAINDPHPRMENSNYRAAVRAFVNWTLANTDRNNDNNNNNGGAGRRNSLPNQPTTAAGRLHNLLSNPSAWSGLGANNHMGPSPLSAESSPANDVHLEVYSSTSANPKSDNEEDRKFSEAVSDMRSRCTKYQRILDSLLNNSNYDTVNFQETLLDFWDDLFPSTAGIHFYNQQSPVPRMSRLHEFLTTPCPKAIGTVQCEIERVKVSSKNREPGDSKKGFGKGRMKGKFFPSYEYRLFIRDAKNDNPFHTSRSPPRKDSVLLVAKNKSGKNRNVATGASSERSGSGVGGFGGMSDLASPGGNKRGITNYYMCLPNQRDVDSHYRSANRNNVNASTLKPGQTSGLAVSPMVKNSRGVPVEVGRLQSNFIGTEFQIFVPATQQQQASDARNSQRNQSRDDDGSSIEGDSRVHPIDEAPPVVTNTAPASTTSRRMSRRGSKLGRLARRASLTMTRRSSTSRRNSDAGNEELPVEEVSDERQQRRGSKKVTRRMSWGTPGNSNKKTSRRAIANNSDSFYEGHSSQLSSSLTNTPVTLGEVENGAITYTANLLGNRPRIMDVCIPKLADDGRVCDEWSGEQQDNGLANVNSGSGCSNTMLDRFKTIQQGLESLEDHLGPIPNNTNSTASNNDTSNHGLMILQNRPPWWNIELGAFVLNFGGRVKVASVKNFQLCERNDQDHIMQFGRIEGRHAFTMDFQYPLTPMQAFAIAISSLQSKISFG